jgi:hypothetical protein
MVREASAMGRAVTDRAEGDSGAPEVGQAQVLETLRLDWGNAWDIGCGDDRWQAARQGGTGHVLTRASADGLELALRVSCGRQR